MPADRCSRFADTLIAYVEEYGVAICKKCQFAIQPSALPSHLLRHQIYRQERRELLQRLSKLKLPEPDNVPLPGSNSTPLPHLTVHQGFKCERLGCEHACVSSKRMSQHWSEQHDVGCNFHICEASLANACIRNTIQGMSRQGPRIFRRSSEATKSATSRSTVQARHWLPPSVARTMKHPTHPSVHSQERIRYQPHAKVHPMR